MKSEDQFRIAFALVFGLSLAVAAYHRWQAAKSGERLSRRAEGRLIFWPLRLSGPSLWIGALIYVIHPGWMAGSALPLPPWVRWIGAISGLLCVGLLYRTLTHLGKNLTDTVVTRAQHTLVTSGPYRWVRHPFYVAIGLLVVSSLLLTANWFIGLSGILVLVLLMIRTRIEERMLIERFGDRYRSYVKRTGLFFPRIGS